MAAVKKQALGRGLGALLQSMETATPSSETNTITAEIAFISLSEIETNPFQPRKEFEQEALNELSASIKQHGVIVPITVTKIGKDKYQLIAGERRFRAAKLAGLKEVPAYIRIATEQEMMEMALVENIQREDLNAIEIALSFQALIEECSLTQDQMSERVGKNRTTITNYLRLLKLPAEIQIAIRNNSISMGHARAIINIDSQEEQLNIVHQIISKELSVRDVEAMVAALKNPKAKKGTKKGELPSIHTHFKVSLTEKLGTQIQISRSQRGKGSISIPFSNDKEFERIIAIIEGK